MTRRRITVYVSLGAVVLIIAAAYLYVFQFGGLERIVRGRIAAALGPDSVVKVSVGDISGSLLSGVRVESIVIAYEDSLGTHTVAVARAVSADYSIRNLWEKRFIFGNVTIDSLALRASRDSNGRWVIPLPLAGAGGGGEPPLFAVRQLSLSDASVTIVMPDDTVRVTDLKLLASVRGEDGTYSLQIERMGYTVDPAIYALSSVTGRVTLAQKNLVFQDCQVQRGDTRLKVSGSLNFENREGAAEFTSDNLDLLRIADFGGPRLEGLLDLGGRVILRNGALFGQITVAGNIKQARFDNVYAQFEYADKMFTVDTLYGMVFGDCSIDGNGYIDFSASPQEYHLGANIRNFNLKSLVTQSFRSDLSGTVILDGRSFRSADLWMKIQSDLFESSFDEYPLHRAAGTMEVTAESIRFYDGFQVDYFENEFVAGGELVYRGDINLAVDVVLNNLDRYRGKLFIDQPGGRGVGHATLTGATNDPDLAGWLASDSLWLYGMYSDSCYATFDIKRFLSGRQGWVETMFGSGEAYNIPFDSAYAMVTLDSMIARIDTVSLADEYTTAATRGILDYGRMPNTLTLDTLALEVLDQMFFNRGELNVLIDSLGFDFSSTSIGWQTASIAFDGRVNYDETMSFEMEAAGVLIKPWIHLFRPEVDVDGYLSGSTRVGGTFMSPVIDLTASIDSLTYRDLTLGDLTAGVKYADRLLTADSLIVSSQPGVYRAAGQFHIDLAMTAGNRDLVPDLPMNIAVSARDTRFDLVSLILPSVEDLQGEFLADFSITGTPTAPHLDGQGYLKNGRLKYFDIADTLKTDSAGVTMENNLIVIDDITTYVYDKKRRRNSYATLEGTLTVKSLDTLHYDLDVTLEKEFPFRYELDDIEGVVEGELHIEGDTPPLVEGDLTLLSCRYRAEFASEDETGSPLMMALSGENTWDLNLNIDILSNYWIKNEDIDAEFAGFMNLIRENGRYRFIGDLEILKGRGYLFDKTFQIESGSMVIFEDIEYPNPRLDITAQTRIPVSSQTEEEDEPRNIDLSVHIGGTLENPELSAAEGETALGNEEILPLLFANYYGSEAGTVGRFEERISQLISARFSQIGTRRLGVEVFEIDPTYEGQLDLARTRVTLGVYTSPKLYLYGTSSVSLDRAQEVGFEYRLSKAFQLEGRRDEDELYHLNLKLHWEFE